MSINATQSHSGEHLLCQKAVCNPEMFEKNTGVRSLSRTVEPTVRKSVASGLEPGPSG